MGRLRRLEAVKVITTGGAGVATGSASVPIPSGIVRLVSLAVDYDGGAPATTDVTVKCSLPVEKTVLTLTNRNTDLPLAQVTEAEVDQVGVDRVTPATKPQLIMGRLIVDVAQCDALTDAVVVSAVVEI